MKIFRKLNNLLGEIKNRSGKKKYFSYEIRVIYYANYRINLARISIDNTKYLIKENMAIPIPANIINEGIVKNINDMAKIIIDMSSALNINRLPILIILPSSLFKLHSFDSSDIRIKSIKDPLIKSKSPFFALDTTIQCHEVSNKYKSLLWVLYAQNELINSWLNVLSIVNSDVVALTTTIPHILSKLIKKKSGSKMVLCDIENHHINIYFLNKEGDLRSHKIPYGISLYQSSIKSDLSKEFFLRLEKSILSLATLSSFNKPYSIYLTGNGLDSLVHSISQIPEGFERIIDLKIEDFTYSITNTPEEHQVSPSILANMINISLDSIK